jgi:hypothetical protein
MARRHTAPAVQCILLTLLCARVEVVTLVPAVDSVCEGWGCQGVQGNVPGEPTTPLPRTGGDAVRAALVFGFPVGDGVYCFYEDR